MTDHTTHFDDEQCRKRGYDVMLDYAPGLAEAHVGHALLTLESERDALRLRVAALEAAISPIAFMHGCGECNFCGFCGERLNAAMGLLEGDTTALRAMLVPAFNAGFNARDNGEGMNGYEDGDDYADRILGASKEGGE